MNLRHAFAAAVASIMFAGLASAQTTIDTFPLWNNSNFINTWGGGGTPTYGQSFTADATHSVLTNMTFSISGSGQSQDYRAYVYQWTGTDTTGAALFTSSVLNYNGNSFQNASAATGSLVLTPGQQYVAFFSVIGEAGSIAAEWAYLGTSFQAGVDGYTGGNFVFNNSTSGFSGGWSNPTFYGGHAADDLAFQLTFSAVPEPTTWALIGVVTLGTGAYTWKKRQQAIKNRFAKVK